MAERDFFESLGTEMLFYEFAKEKLTKEESEALEKFDEAYDYETGNTALSGVDEHDLIVRLFENIPGARAAFNKFNKIVENLEKQSKQLAKYKSN